MSRAGPSIQGVLDNCRRNQAQRVSLSAKKADTGWGERSEGCLYWPWRKLKKKRSRGHSYRPAVQKGPAEVPGPGLGQPRCQGLLEGRRAPRPKKARDQNTREEGSWAMEVQSWREAPLWNAPSSPFKWKNRGLGRL